MLERGASERLDDLGIFAECTRNQPKLHFWAGLRDIPYEEGDVAFDMIAAGRKKQRYHHDGAVPPADE